MVGNLAAAIDLDNGDAGAAEQVFGLAGQALGEHRIVFHHPQFVFGIGISFGAELLHRFEYRQIGAAPQKDGFHYSTTFTIGCAVRLR